MSAIIIDGKKVSQDVKERVRLAVDDFRKKHGVQPGLATVLVGEDPASQVYIKNKIKSTEACGMNSIHKQLLASTTQDELLAVIAELNQDQSVHGILVQLPLPAQIDENTVITAIDPTKDVDGFHPYNYGLLAAGQATLQPCTPLGVMELLKAYDISLEGRDVLILGRSNIVGKPQALMMVAANATVTVAHSRTKNLQEKIVRADVVVAAVGRAKMLKGDWLKPGAVVIDVGINRDDSGKLCGDVDFESAKEVASHITPVPGGVGPMTIAMLMQNTLTAAKQIVGE